MVKYFGQKPPAHNILFDRVSNFWAQFLPSCNKIKALLYVKHKTHFIHFVQFLPVSQTFYEKREHNSNHALPPSLKDNKFSETQSFRSPSLRNESIKLRNFSDFIHK